MFSVYKVYMNTNEGNNNLEDKKSVGENVGNCSYVSLWTVSLWEKIISKVTFLKVYLHFFYFPTSDFSSGAIKWIN